MAMQDLMILLAKGMTFDQLITKLDESLTKYKEDKNDENKNKLLITAQLLLVNSIDASAIQLMKDFENVNEMMDKEDKVQKN